MLSDCITGQQFTSLLLTQTPYFDKEIISDIRPEDGEIGHTAVGTYEAYTTASHTKDRLKAVFPNTAAEWQAIPSTACIGKPCDPPEYKIGWGSERVTYAPKRQSHVTDLLCFDQVITRRQAKEHVRQIISDILKPATSAIMSMFVRKQRLALGGTNMLADGSLTAFTHSWSVANGNEAILNVSGEPTSKLTPQMLQRQVEPLKFLGYFGKQPFGDMPDLIELVTDIDTCFDLSKSATDANINDRWRFQEWEQANRYYKYNYKGKIGDYVVRVDPFQLRFNKISTNTFRLVLPYENSAATEGIGDTFNTDFQNAQYAITTITHRMGIRILTANLEAVNAMMPFAVRSLGGQWFFAMDNLGADCNGNPIDNKRRNKGQFVGDFELAAEPLYVEFVRNFFHKREPAKITTIDVCASDPGDPAQSYSAANAICGNSLLVEPTANSSGDYVIAANTIYCGTTQQTHAAINVPDLPSLVNQLNAILSGMGVWILSGTNIVLTETSCGTVEVPFVT